MATKKTKNKDDARKAAGRFMDQPGQWVDATPASVKRKRSRALASLAKEMSNGKKKR